MSVPIVETRRRTSLAKPAAIALAVWIVGWLGNGVGMVVSDWTGWVGWLAVPAVSASVAVLGAIASSYLEQRLVDPVTHQPIPDPAHPVPGTGFSGWSVRFVLIALVVGGGILGLVLTVGIRYVTGWVTGDEPGVDRLAETVTVDDRGLSVSVTAFEETRHYTRVLVQVSNGVGNPITVPLFENVSLVGGDGTPLKVDHWRSDWNQSINPGVRHKGALVFGGHLPDGVPRATLEFHTIFEQGFDGPDSITVPDIGLRSR